MFHIILHQPEIPPNTGNIIRLCANTGCSLHLIEPLGFKLDAASLRRAGLDYAQMTRVQVYPDIGDCLQQLRPRRLFAIETAVAERYSDARFAANDAFLFGSETRGLPPLLPPTSVAQWLRIPMLAGNRSLNLANAVAVVVYEAWRQNDFSVPADRASQIQA